MAQISFTFDTNTAELLERLKKHYNATSKAEVVRKAIALLEIARQASERGGEMAVINMDETVERVLVR